MNYGLFFVPLHKKMQMYMKRHTILLLFIALLPLVSTLSSTALAQPRFVPDTDIKKVG